MGVVIPNLLTEDRVSGAQIIDGSLKFDDAKKQHLTWTPSTSGNRGVWTISFWAKLNRITGYQYFFSAGTNLSSNFMIFQQDNGASTVAIYDYTSSFQWFIDPVDVFRDPSAWYHFLINLNTPNQSVNFYVNNRLVGQVNTSPSSNYQGFWNHNVKHRISDDTYSIGCQLSQFYNIDGQALGPEYFGYTDPLTNTWRPKKYTGNFNYSAATGTLLNYNNNTGLPTFSAQDGSSPPVGFPVSNGFDNNSATYVNMTTSNGQWSKLTFGQAITNVTNITIGYDGEGDVGYNGSVVNSSVGFNDSRQTITLYSGSAITLTDLYFVSQPGNGVCRLYDITITTSTVSATELTFISGTGTNSFFLPFDGSAPIGQDQSGRGNNWTPVNFGGSNTIEKATGALPILNTDGGGKVARVGVRTDNNSSSLVLALPLVGNANDISATIKGSGSNKTVTVTNAVSSVDSNFYGGSYYFDGTGDYLTLSANSDFNFGTGDFTIEAWVKVTIPLGNFRQTLCGQTDNVTGRYGVRLDNNGSGNFGFTYYSSVAADYRNLVSDLKVTSGVWSHIAVVRQSGVFKFFVNGVKASTDVSSYTTELVGNDSSAFYVARNVWDGSSYDAVQYVQDLRVYKGLAKYTQNFIPASTDPDILPDTPSGVAYSSNVALVPSTDGAVAFDGTNDYMEVARNDDFDFGTGSFTMECFAYFSSFTAEGTVVVGKSQSSGSAGMAAGIFVTSSGGITFYASNNGGYNVGASGGTLGSNKWYHLAFVRSGNNFYGFVDGILSATATDSNPISHDTTGSFGGIMMGGYSSAYGVDAGRYDLNGFVSNLHITKGTALYTSNFTPPTAPITPVANTKLLCCKSQVYQNVGDVGVTTSWSNYTSCPAGFYSGNPVYNMFDGSTSTSAQSGGTVGDNGIITFTPPSPIVYSNTLRVYTDNGNYNLNGTGWSGTMGAGWYTITSSGGGTLTSLAFRWYNQPAGGYVNVMAIEVDGTILTDGIITKGNTAATNFNPFTANINAVRGQESGWCTWNPLTNYVESGTYTLPTISGGNLTIKANTTRFSASTGTVFASSGKWYGEIYFTGGQTSDGSLGIVASTFRPSLDGNRYIGRTSDSYGFYGDGRKIYNDSFSSYSNSWGLGDTLGLAMDLDSGKVWLSINGIWQAGGNPVTGTNEAFSGINSSLGWSWGAAPYNDQVYNLNAGQKPFKFPPPPGFQPLALANTPRPTIVRPDQYVGIVTYSGNSTKPRTISGLNFKADLIWVKSRTDTYNHWLQDSVRGFTVGGKKLRPNGTDAEGSSEVLDDYGYISGSSSSGFTIDGTGTTAQLGQSNLSGQSYVAWAWKAGGNSNTYNINDIGYSTASAAGLTAGTITPTGASVNTKSGFSIIGYTGTGANATISHGLGNAPSFIIIKKRTSSPGDTNWRVYHSALGNTKAIFLSTTGTPDTNSVYWNNTSPTSSVFSLGSDDGLNASSQTHIAYLWAEISGFSKFGSYTGNGSADGTMVVTGFKPRWLMIKDTTLGTENWRIFDTVRETYNPTERRLIANGSAIEAVGVASELDILSNGFKLRSTDGASNGTGVNYIYAAFAEAPTFNLYGGQANAR